MYIRPELRAPIVTGVIAAASGLGVGYYLGRRKTDTVVTTETHIEYETVVECEKCKQRSNEQQGMVNVIRDEGYIAVNDDILDAEEAKDRAAFEEHPSVGLVLVDTAAELINTEYDVELDEDDVEEERSRDTPYVISKAEWDADEHGFNQVALTWYAGDKVMVDEQTRPVPAIEKVIGRLEFGRGSGDGNLVYIRNEELGAEYEITRVDRSYTIDILGLEAEEEADAEDLKHSQRIPKFRD